MSLELLISKYIDGELSSIEDAKLRQMLKENPFSKDKFDRSVELHLDLLEDSSNIQIPNDLLRKTEEVVMMKIFAAPAYAQSNTEKTKTLKKIIYRIPTLAAIVTFLAFISFLRIGDNNYLRTIELYSPAISSEVVIPSERLQTINQRNSVAIKLLSSITAAESVDQENVLSNNEIESLEEISDINSMVVSSNTESETIADLPLELAPKSDDMKIGVNSDRVAGQSTNSMLNSNIPTNNNYNDKLQSIKQSAMPSVNYGFSGGPEITAVQLNTLISRDFVRTGIATSNNTPMSSMSQSIGYNIGKNITIGLEFGITELNYDYIKYIPLSSGQESSGSSSMGVNTPGGGSGGLGSQINVPVTLQRQAQFFWGMAFYDSEIVSLGDLSLIGRIGLGATNDGPLGLGRITAKYVIFSNLAITAGTEGRLLMMKTPLLENVMTTISSYGFNYGVQLNF